MSSKKNTPYPQLKKPIDLLFGETESVEPGSEQFPKGEIAITKIKLPTSQPRRYFDQQKLEELSRSIKEVGILEPLLVRPLVGGDYELIAGERRYKAAQMAGLTEVPVAIREMNDVTVRQVRLVENLQREDLNPWEETDGILELLSVKLSTPLEEVPRLLYRLQNEQKKTYSSRLEGNDVLTHNVMGNPDLESSLIDGSFTHNVMGNPDLESQMPESSVTEDSNLKIIKEVFAALGRMGWESFVKNRLPLLKLPQDVIAALRNGEIEYTKAKLIARVKDEEVRTELLKKAIEQNLSITEIQALVNAILNQKLANPTPSLKSEYKELSKQLGASKVWDNPKKQKTLEKLLAQIKSILKEE